MMGRAWCSPLLCMGLLMKADTVLAAAGLPDTPVLAPTVMTLYLELVINGQASGEVVPVQVREGRYYVAADVLRKLHVRTPPTTDGLVAVNQLADITMEYDSAAQQLKLNLPPDWLPEQELGMASRLRPWDASSDQGFLLNYDIYASDLTRTRTYASAWTEQRLFGNWGVLSNTGVYRDAFSGDNSAYLRYDTRWTYSDPDSVRTYTVGDLITGSLPWGSAVRLGGVQIARNFGLRPDLVPYPLPRFSGQAAVPSAVDLFINGYKANSEIVQPGPFTLNTLPFINGAGEASVVTTDALGRQVLTTVPFYVSNTLLKTGGTDYAFSLGALRQDYGLKNFSYGQTATSGSYRRGINDAWTLEGRGEWTEGLAVLGGRQRRRAGPPGRAQLLAHRQPQPRRPGAAVGLWLPVQRPALQPGRPAHTTRRGLHAPGGHGGLRRGPEPQQHPAQPQPIAGPRGQRVPGLFRHRGGQPAAHGDRHGELHPADQQQQLRHAEPEQFPAQR